MRNFCWCLGPQVGTVLRHSWFASAYVHQELKEEGGEAICPQGFLSHCELVLSSLLFSKEETALVSKESYSPSLPPPPLPLLETTFSRMIVLSEK